MAEISALLDSAAKQFSKGFGASVLLIILPCLLLYLGFKEANEAPLIGLPAMAILGIMLLFGSLALVATLFAKLKLTDPAQALALPEGSIRATIALSLIVLFAIISIMLFQSTGKPYVIRDLSYSSQNEMLKLGSPQVLAVVPLACSAGGTTCTAEERTYDVHVVATSPDALDLAKQLLVLIGTLMTSVTSFYFASRATAQALAPRLVQTPPSEPGEEAEAQLLTDEEHLDSCDVPRDSNTLDEELPPSTGGVAP